MRFVHIADMHFDTPFTTLNTKGDYGKIRRMDQREILKKIINYIKENKILRIIVGLKIMQSIIFNPFCF